MTTVFQGYKKSKTKIITCKTCDYHIPPGFQQKRIRCVASNASHSPLNGYAVGSKMVCDYHSIHHKNIVSML